MRVVVCDANGVQSAIGAEIVVVADSDAARAGAAMRRCQGVRVAYFADPDERDDLDAFCTELFPT